MGSFLDKFGLAEEDPLAVFVDYIRKYRNNKTNKVFTMSKSRRGQQVVMYRVSGATSIDWRAPRSSLPSYSV